MRRCARIRVGGDDASGADHLVRGEARDRDLRTIRAVGRLSAAYSRRETVGPMSSQQKRLEDGTPYVGELGELAYDPDEDKMQCHLCGGWYRVIGSSHLRRAARLDARGVP